MFEFASKLTGGGKSVVFCMAFSLLAFSAGCGSLSQKRMGTAFDSSTEKEAFEKAVAADSFPRANQAFIAGMIDR